MELSFVAVMYIQDQTKKLVQLNPPSVYIQNVLLYVNSGLVTLLKFMWLKNVIFSLFHFIFSSLTCFNTGGSEHDSSPSKELR
jgi:hypothetical protein